MNKNEIYDIEFEDLENQSSIRVLADKNRLFAAWLKKDEMYLEVHFDKKENNFIRLEGSLGQKLKKTDFSNEDKLERVLESLNNGLWNYFHPNETSKRNTI
jgi:hypothetical protein